MVWPPTTVACGVCGPTVGPACGAVVTGCGAAEGDGIAGEPASCWCVGGGEPAGWLAGRLWVAVGGEADSAVGVCAGGGDIGSEPGASVCTGTVDGGAADVGAGALCGTGADGAAVAGVCAGADGAGDAVCAGTVGAGVYTGGGVCGDGGATGGVTSGAWNTGGWAGVTGAWGIGRGATGMVGPDPQNAGGVPVGQGLAVAVAASSVHGLITVAAVTASSGFLTMPPFASAPPTGGHRRP